MTLVLYLLKRFFPIFLGTLAFFSFAIVLVDLLTNLWRFILEEVAISTIISISLLYIPKAISFSMPLAILFSSAYTLSALYATNELSAIFSSGISLITFTLPILIFSFLASIGLFFFEDRFVVPMLQQKVEAQNLALNEPVSYDNDRIVVLADGGLTVYRADYYNDTQQRLTNVDIYVRNEDKTLNKIIRADAALWNGESWNLSNAHTYINTGTELVYTKGTAFTSTELPDTFRNIVVSVEEVGVKEAKEYIDKLRRTGLPFSEELSQYHEKFSFSFVIFITVFLSIGLSGKSKKNVLLVSLALCVSAAVVYYVFQMVTMLMAKFGYLSPFAGAWLPVIVFIGISIVLLRFART